LYFRAELGRRRTAEAKIVRVQEIVYWTSLFYQTSP
jgi:hypothetical protein